MFAEQSIITYFSKIEAAIVEAFPDPSPPALKSSSLAKLRTCKFLDQIEDYVIL